MKIKIKMVEINEDNLRLMLQIITDVLTDKQIEYINKRLENLKKA